MTRRLRRPLVDRLVIAVSVVGLIASLTACSAADPSASLASPASTAPTSATSATTDATDATDATEAGTPAGTPADAPASTAPATYAPVVVEELGRGEQPAGIDLQVDGPVEVAFRRITLKPGAGTGKHCHDGQLIAVVEQGEFTHYAPVYPDGVHVYEAGDSIVEGAHYVHEGKNEGTEDVVLLVTYVIADGDPLAETDLSKCSG